MDFWNFYYLHLSWQEQDKKPYIVSYKGRVHFEIKVNQLIQTYYKINTTSNSSQQIRPDDQIFTGLIYWSWQHFEFDRERDWWFLEKYSDYSRDWSEFRKCKYLKLHLKLAERF